MTNGFVARVLAAAALALAQSRVAPKGGYSDWTTYGGPGGIHYSTLRQINLANVSKLAVAWTFDTGDAFSGSEMQCNPIVVNGVLYATTPKARVIALDAVSGKQRWAFDPNEGRKTVGKTRNRGVTYWSGGRERRIYFVNRNFL